MTDPNPTLPSDEAPAVTFPEWLPGLRNGDELRVEQSGARIRYFLNGREVFPPGTPPSP